MIRELWNMLGKDQRGGLLFVLVLMVLMPFVELLGVGSIFTFVKAASDVTLLQESHWFMRVAGVIGFDAGNSQQVLFWLGLAVFCSIVLRNLIFGLNTYVSTKFSTDTTSFLSVGLLRSYLHKDYLFHVGNNTAVLGKDVLNEVTGFVSSFIMSVLTIISSAVMICALCGLMLWYNPITTGIAIAALGGGYGGLYMFFRQIIHDLGKRRLEANSIRFTAVHEALSSYRDAVLRQCRPFFIEKYQSASNMFYITLVKSTLITQLPKHFLEIMLFGGVILIVITSLRQSSFAETITLVSLYATAGYRVMPQLDNVFRSFSSMRFNKVVFDMIHSNIKIRLSHCVQEGGALPVFTNRITMRDVSFSYRKKVKALDKINLEIKKKQSVAFVGHTGSGKTTLMNILLGLLTPTKGTIRMDNIILNEENFSCWQRNIGYVPQDIFLLDASVRNNIAFGIPDADIDEEAVTRAAKTAHIHDFIEEKLEHKYATRIGERGVQLSGGQRQRVGIARALYHNPEVLIFDEATSALDSVTERIITQAIEELSGNKTIIIVAHRLSTLVHVDQVYVMENGRVVAEGTYNDLFRDNPHFRALALVADTV